MAQPQLSSTSNDALDNQKLLEMLQQLQSMNNKQQNVMVYSPESPPQTANPQRSARATDSPTSNSNPNRGYSYLRPTSTSSTQDQQNTIQSSVPQQSQHRYSPQYTDVQKPTIQPFNDANAYSNQRETNDKSAEKEDRQGHQYPYEAYSGHDSGYGHQARNPVYAHESQYAHHEPVHPKPLSLPIPQLSIKFDPLRLLKLLLSGLPRPLFNLNGKIFLGLELGKGAGLTVGAPKQYGGGYGGGKNLITIG